ncbi:MAG: GAF domain-containing protein [Anaerolineae bacterium]|nr:GAF domain-containing protein [Anaerolineae bacterium]
MENGSPTEQNTLHDWLHTCHIAQQALESAPDTQRVIETLRDVLTWLLGDTISVQILHSQTPEAYAHLPEIAQEAALSLTPQTAADSCTVALPLTAGDEPHGLVIITSPAPLDPIRTALAYQFVNSAAATLARLAWPASPQIFRQLVENANVAIDVAALDGTITYANHAAAQLYGFQTPQEMLGRKVGELYFGDEEARVAREVIAQSRTAAGWSGEVTHKRIDGKPLPVRLAVFAIRDQQQRMTSYGAIIQNLGEQQQLLYSLQRQTRRLRAAVEVSRAATSKLDIDALARQVASVTQALFGYDLVAVSVLENGVLQVKAVYTPEGHLQTVEMPAQLAPDDLNYAALTARAALIVNDSQSAQRIGLCHALMPVGSEVILPMRLGDAVIGTLDVQSRQAYAFQPEDVETLQGIADQLAMALDNARLFAAERSKVGQLAALNAISHQLVAAYNLDEVWDNIRQQVAALFHVSTFYVMRYDETSDTLQMLYLHADGVTLPSGQRYPVSGFGGYVVRSGKPLYIEDLAAQREWIESLGIQRMRLTEQLPTIASWLGMPLRARNGAVIGVLSMQSDRPRAFGADEQQVFATIATQVSLALENAALFNQLTDAATQLKERARRLESLYKIGTLLSASLDRNRILTLAAEQIMRLLKVDHCGILLLSSKGDQAQFVAEYPLSPYGLGKVPIAIFEHLHDQDVIVCHDVAQDERLSALLPILRHNGVRSLVMARMFAKDRLIGAISVEAVGVARTFTYEEIETCRTLAAQVALAVENADLYARALEANELKSQFLATVSHELRTPLNAIMGYTEMIIKGVYGSLTGKQHERLQRVYDNATHLLALINDVLDLAKIESGRLTLNTEPLDVQPVLQDAIAQIAPLAEAKHLSVYIDVPQGLPRVEADRVRLRQIVLNLLSNAVKFTRKGGITVRAYQWQLAAPLEGVPLTAGNWLCIAVADSGIGIAPEHFEVIFDAFRQVDGSIVREFQGTGLGLPITRQLVEMHGGKIWLESEVGRGSTFTVALPALPEKAE